MNQHTSLIEQHQLQLNNAINERNQRAIDFYTKLILISIKNETILMNILEHPLIES